MVVESYRETLGQAVVKCLDLLLFSIPLTERKAAQILHSVWDFDFRNRKKPLGDTPSGWPVTRPESVTSVTEVCNFAERDFWLACTRISTGRPFWVQRASAFSGGFLLSLLSKTFTNSLSQ